MVPRRLSPSQRPLDTGSPGHRPRLSVTLTGRRHPLAPSRRCPLPQRPAGAALAQPRGAGGGGLWTKHHILLGPRCYFTSDPPLVELSPCSKGGQGEGEAAVIAHQSVSQGIEPGTTTMDFKPSVSVLFGHYSLP